MGTSKLLPGQIVEQLQFANAEGRGGGEEELGASGGHVMYTTRKSSNCVLILELSVTKKVTLLYFQNVNWLTLIECKCANDA